MAHRDIKWGTSVKGPLKMVRLDNVSWMQSEDNQAMLAGPGASLASKDTACPLMANEEEAS